MKEIIGIGIVILVVVLGVIWFLSSTTVGLAIVLLFLITLSLKGLFITRREWYLWTLAYVTFKTQVLTDNLEDPENEVVSELWKDKRFRQYVWYLASNLGYLLILLFFFIVMAAKGIYPELIMIYIFYLIFSVILGLKNVTKKNKASVNGQLVAVQKKYDSELEVYQELEDREKWWGIIYQKIISLAVLGILILCLLKNLNIFEIKIF